jgi:hypothetical protein
MLPHKGDEVTPLDPIAVNDEDLPIPHVGDQLVLAPD